MDNYKLIMIFFVKYISIIASGVEVLISGLPKY